MKLRLGVIGLGEGWERRYLPALRVLSDRFNLVAVFESVSQRARMAARESSLAVHDSFWTLCRRNDVDAVLVLNPRWLGPLPVLAACEFGKAVYLGASVLLTLEEVTELREAVFRSGVAFMVEFYRRYAPATIRLKELIATRLGPPRLLFCHRRLSHYLKANGTSGPHPVDPIRLDLVELVDWCRFVVGEQATSVMGVLHHCPEKGELDYLMLNLDFSPPGQLGRGPTAQISCGRYIPPHWHEAVSYRPLAELQVVCERGVAFVDLPTTLVWFDEAGRHQELLDHERPIEERLLLHFYRAATSLVQRASDIDDLRFVLSTIHRAEESAAAGRRISLDG